MIETTCSCGAAVRAAESEMYSDHSCGKCASRALFVAAEQMADGAGSADFDAALSLPSQAEDGSPQQWHFFLGGVADVEIGKLPEKQIVLPGSKVSRSHCKLVRVDFGPSKWKIVDNRSTNGLFVNQQRIAETELSDGDVVRIGEYEMTYRTCAPPPPPPIVGGISCPGCGATYQPLTKICIPCGLDLRSGKHLVTSRAIDENDLAVRADTWVRTLSWIIPFGLFPIASEAFGTRRPVATWVITAITALASIAFLVANYGDDGSVAVKNLELWSGSRKVFERTLPARVREIQEELGDKTLIINDKMLEQLLRDSVPAGVGFHWYQLLTHALLHDPGHWFDFLLHLSGNLLFLFVFGMRVNELIGNTKFAIVYPLLAIGSGLVDVLIRAHEPLRAGIGASGAIMGLAGMYLVFFPIQKVHMTIWIRLGILTGWRCFYKVFRMRGFWLLVCWVAFNDGMPMILGSMDGVNHLAHVGGFAIGVVIALIMLLGRLTDARRADILSVFLGKRAWALLGRPHAEASTA